MLELSLDSNFILLTQTIALDTSVIRNAYNAYFADGILYQKQITHIYEGPVVELLVKDSLCAAFLKISLLIQQ